MRVPHFSLIVSPCFIFRKMGYSAETAIRLPHDSTSFARQSPHVKPPLAGGSFASIVSKGTDRVFQVQEPEES